MITFNLAEEPCIPVMDSQGHLQTLSLRETLLQAPELQELQHSSPTITASLLRLLVVLTADIFPMTNSSAWIKLWAKGTFDAGEIEAYFQQHSDRFDLFHPQYPFYQCAALEDDLPVQLGLFDCSLSSGNNATLFDHSLDSEERDYTPVEAFHLLLATQNFALAGLLRRTTRFRGKAEPLYWQNAFGGALIPGAMIWLTGENLFETLMLNLPYVGDSDDDRPAWRLDHPEKLCDRMDGRTKIKLTIPPRGVRDRLTLQSRLIRLLPVRADNGEIVVRRAAFNHGRSLALPEPGNFDPMQAYRVPNKKEGYVVTRLSAEKAAWRDVHTLLAGLKVERTDGKFERVLPCALENLSLALEYEAPGLDPNQPLRLHVAGIANDQAKILLWRHDRMDAPAQVLGKPKIAERIGVLLGEAETIASDLRGATRRLCEIFLAPLSRDPAGKPIEGAMKADPDRVTALADCLDSRPAYWARLESGFHRLLFSLEDKPGQAEEDWRDRVEAEARRAFEEVKLRLGDSPQTQKAVALVNTYFRVPSRRA